MIDAHCHLDLYPNPNGLIHEARAARVTMIAVTNLPSHYRQAIEHVHGYNHIKLALGMHPLLAKQHRREQSLFIDLVSNASFIGAIGLDFSRDGFSTKPQQTETLRLIFERIQDRPRIISLHSRRAEQEVVEHTIMAGFARTSILHWYTGSISTLRDALAAGLSFSVNPAMIISPTGRKTIEQIPKDRILSESDGPHIMLDNRVAMPWDVSAVQIHLAQVWNQSVADVERQLHANLRSLLDRVRV